LKNFHVDKKIGIGCDHCGTFPVRGKRWKCVENKRYNLCDKCYLGNLGTEGRKFARFFHPVVEEHETLQLIAPKNRNIRDLLYNSVVTPKKKKRKTQNKKIW
jgi:hypothetical protein